MTLPKWLRRRTAPALFKQNVNVEKFKSDSSRVGALEELIKNPVFHHAWSVVMTLAPPHREYDNASSALFDLGVARGMRKAFEDLQFLAKFDEKDEPLAVTWGVEATDEAQGPTQIV